MKVNGKDDIPYMKWKIKFMFETTNQINASIRKWNRLQWMISIHSDRYAGKPWKTGVLSLHQQPSSCLLMVFWIRHFLGNLNSRMCEWLFQSSHVPLPEKIPVMIVQKKQISYCYVSCHKILILWLFKTIPQNDPNGLSWQFSPCLNLAEILNHN